VLWSCWLGIHHYTDPCHRCRLQRQRSEYNHSPGTVILNCTCVSYLQRDSLDGWLMVKGLATFYNTTAYRETLTSSGLQFSDPELSIYNFRHQLKTFLFAQSWRWHPSALETLVPVSSINLLFTLHYITKLRNDSRWCSASNGSPYPNERTLDPAVCSYNRPTPPTPQPDALYGLQPAMFCDMVFL